MGLWALFLTAGFVRNRYWDSLYPCVAVSGTSDIDVVYFNSGSVSKSLDLEYESVLCKYMRGVDWQVRNQARMHNFGGYAPFTDLSDALTHWSETATAIGVRLSANDEMQVIAPFGLDDLYNHVLRITPVMYANDPAGFEGRVKHKQWRMRWPEVKVVGCC
jgi:hypothetical protein